MPPTPQRVVAIVVLGLAALARCRSTETAAIKPGPPPPIVASRPPNIVLILADDLGVGELGCYGQEIIRTPNIDGLAREGMRFEQAYAGSCVCAPSRCTLLTGYHTGRAAIRDNRELSPTGQEPLPAGCVTIAELLQRRGYATAAIGKWGLGVPGSSGDPAKQGFDLFFGYYCQREAHTHCPSRLYRNGAEVALPGNRETWTDGTIPAGASYAPDLFRAEAIEFIAAHRDQPFFLYFATTVPHVALQVPDDSLREYVGAIDDKPYDGKQGYLRHPTPHAAYAAMVTRLDRDVGALLNALREQGLERDTLVIFTSDNGPTYAGGADSAFFRSAAELRGLKGELYEGGIRTPLVVRWPSHVAAGTTSDAVTANWDLFATIASFGGVAPDALPADIDGIDLSPALLGTGKLGPRAPLYWEYATAPGWQAVRIDDYKAIRRGTRKNHDAQIALYDLTNDPSETRDVAAEHPEVVARARAAMDARTPSSVAEWNF
ncbi:MAG: arylsulfatase [Phycisphaerales bacterium]